MRFIIIIIMFIIVDKLFKVEALALRDETFSQTRAREGAPIH